MSNVLITSLAGNLVSFSCGTFITWSSPEIGKLSNYNETPFAYPLDKEQGSWVSGCLPLGAVFGPFIYGYLADSIGRKYTILLIGLPFLLASLIQAFGKVVALFYLSRFMSGLATGGLFMIMPNYIGEIADSKNRGAMGSILNLLLCSGMLFTYSVGPYINVSLFNSILSVFPAIFAVLFFFIAPESAYYYLQKGQTSLARTALQKVRGPNVKVEEELNLIQAKIKEAGDGSVFDIFKTKGLRKAFIITVGLLFFQQFSGICAVLFYAQNIFQDAGVDLAPAVCSIVVGVVQFATTFVTPLTVDKLGRKMLLYIAAIGCIISEGLLGLYSYLKDSGSDVSSLSVLPIVCLIVYIITYNFGFGPLPWMIMGELFPSNVKSIASSLCTGICWSLAFLITKYFEAVKDSVGMGPCFWIFTACCALSVPFIYFLVLETKGKTLEEIQDELEQ